MTYWTILLATEAVEEGGGLFDINATLPLMGVQFLILVIVLNAIFYRPLGQAIDERADFIRSRLLQARERREKAQTLARQYERELVDVRREAQEIVAAAQAEAQKMISEQMQQAQQEVQAEREKASQEIATQKAEAFSNLEGQVSALSRQILEKLLGPEFVK
jgi:F-type H+-transporting ATPase subunit b